jgi:hypothetical protein
MPERCKDHARLTCLDEVIQLHQFLGAWLRGDTGEPGGIPLRLANALSDDFCVIHPSGLSDTRDKVVANFRSAWGTRPADFYIQITDIEHRFSFDAIQVIAYTETHHEPVPSQRRSTAILESRNRQRPKWCYLHETRIVL